ncbi:MAG: proline dehydrogenase family protein [Planctomycetota bacterium]|jgi:proline dehydrogenase
MSLFDRLIAATMPLVPRPMMRRLSARYIAGEERADALDRGRMLAGKGYRLTFDLLGEAVTTRAEVEAAAAEYHGLLDALAEGGLERNISLKPTQMGLDIGEDFCHDVVASVLEHAARLDAFVRFEMEESSTVDATLRVFARLRRAYPGTVGCVLQSMLHRTLDDIRTLLEDDAPLNVRMVKGIYVEPPEVAHQHGGAVNQAWLEGTRMLLEGGAFVAAATHDESLVEGLEELRAGLDGAEERSELQMLCGVREEFRQVWRGRGLPVRVYLPYGRAWRKYVERRLRKNPKLARYALTGMFKRQEKLGD